MTNATKAAIIAIFNTLIGVLAANGTIKLSSHTTQLVLVGVNLALGGITVLTRKLSPRWNGDAKLVGNDLTRVINLILAVFHIKPSTTPPTTKK